VNDVFGNLEVVNADSDAVRLKNKDKTITLTRDGTIDVMGEIKFRVADSSTLRYYPKVDYEISGEVTPTPTVTGPGGTGTVKPTNVTGTATVTGTGPVTTGTEKPPATPSGTGTPREPGFTTALAMVGLLAVAFLVLRQRK
ncbi:MAG: S-layer protein domain-containing protein, partial [Candidatus Methanoperedens sp.]|nr:S-layer protein domain-containing protein [Candidatus Methanoperedens sp.]